ncbi:hypothetical protein EB796_004172 [Bugula neritina]|uniref:Uncharacterized protein n=1 Tax=Bugula neritina TaxID=10212 RepID=A0A7J7KFT2_BUGNE|nr:hypothetical protein EB796_004172 [Bugula neritina]
MVCWRIYSTRRGSTVQGEDLQYKERIYSTRRGSTVQGEDLQYKERGASNKEWICKMRRRGGATIINSVNTSTFASVSTESKPRASVPHSGYPEGSPLSVSKK